MTNTSKRKPVISPMLSITPRSKHDVLPLSFAQQRLWFLDQLQPNSPLYSVPVFLQLQGPLHLHLLELSLKQLIQRHEMLRTHFPTQQHRPVQVISPQVHLPFPLLDLRSLSAPSRLFEARRLAQQEAERPFDLARVPLLRACVLRLESQEHWLLLTLHHIIIDQWGRDLLLRELSQFYNTAVRAAVPSLAPLPVQYADFALWQRDWLPGMVWQAQWAYWQEQLAQAPLVLDLPIARPRPAVQTFKGALYAFHLPTALTVKLRFFSRGAKVTMFMTLLAAFQTLLMRYTGRCDILVGSPIANRRSQELEALIGCFANTLVLRANLAGDPSFRQFLRRVREVCLGAYAHQDFPFEQLVEELQVPRDLSCNPLVQVMFSLKSSLSQPFAFEGVTTYPLSVERRVSKFDLVMNLTERPEGLEGRVRYNTDLFEAESIQRLVQHFERLLEGIVSQPEQRLSQLPLLSQSEQQQILLDWNTTQQECPHEFCLHQLFEEQVRCTPDAVALVYDTEQLSYDQLNQRANQLAHHLQALGVRPEVRVGLSLPRTPLLLVGLLAIWKAGGVYVPLDPSYPSQRLAFMYADSQFSLLLSHTSLLSILPSFSSCPPLCLDTLLPTLNALPTDNLQVAQHPASLAYLIYTSGSTGLPKGVQIAHRGACNLACAQRQIFGLRPSDRQLQFASLSFDASIFEILLALLSGAALVLPLGDFPLIGEMLYQMLKRESISAATLPPTVLAVSPRAGSDSSFPPAWQEGQKVSLPALRILIVAGEACPASLVAAWGRGRRFFNAYGPTEATVWATVACCEPEGGLPPIGRPIVNMQVYVLDVHLQPVPVGCVGELYLGGAGIARGYFHQPGQTAERFVPHPFSQQPGERLYKTGDLVRYRYTGELEFVGRVDQQIKLRGFRIEPGELEAILNQHLAVSEAIVQLLDECSGHKRLVAYLILESGQQLVDSDLRAFLRQRLPNYMVPDAFVVLEQLPLTSHGKVDRKTLVQQKKPLSEDTSLTTSILPQTRLEQDIARVWREVLGREQIGIHDNFFDIGGHSMLVIQVQAEMQVVAAIHLSLVDLFQYPTISALAEYIVRKRQMGISSEQPGHRRANRRNGLAGLRRAIRQEYRAGKESRGNTSE